ncbi:hypothetical protein L9F63_003980 [Diploptera punctata]|uniref:Uncharacterized protein n=1 Tax=Diploptera punctata TaxID=6984 RepID=A0AAD8E7P5_DIPPU|nr:hypothetical protein L9F63_003980 [Diploptera punctata]
MGCVLKIGSFGPEPCTKKGYYLTKEGENKSVVEGLGMDPINVFAREMNFTLYYLEPIIELDINSFLELFSMVTNAETDIIGGCFPIANPLDSMTDLSFPIFVDTMKFIVPCPKPLTKTHKVLTLFSLSTWISMGIVFIVVSFLFWSLSKYPSRRNDFTGFNLLAQCFSAAWAVLLGISVPQIPLSMGARSLFIIYVSYCFAISTVFQAYFTTYLVEPGYEARLESLDDVMRAGLKFGFYELIVTDSVIDLKDLQDFDRSPCSDIKECIFGVMFKRNMFSIVLSNFPPYLARASGISDQNTVVCFLEQSMLSISIGLSVRKGSPLLDILNKHIIRYLQGGLVVNYWSIMNHEINLKAKRTEENSEYVVFTLNHLTPAFMLLLFGYILSAISFLCELIQFKIKKQVNKSMIVVQIPN